jgi:tetratricopeptide (TPR) repeat protein
MLISLWAISLSGCSKGSEADTNPPDAPIGISATRGNARVTLTWNAVSANDLAGYHPYHRPTAGGSAVRGAMVTGTSTAVTGLTNGVEYAFYITAVDEAGNESPASQETTATPNDEISLSQSGWVAWEAGDYTAAEALFLDAFNFDPDYADAYNGLGWTDLRRGNQAAAAGRFELAITNGLTSEDARVGALAAYRDLTGGLATAMSYGTTALQNDPTYVFSHDPSIDADMVRLMLAQVHFRLGEANFIYAQQIMDQLVSANGLDPADSGTWSVGGTVYQTYAGALLALIQSAFDAFGS